MQVPSSSPASASRTRLSPEAALTAGDLDPTRLARPRLAALVRLTLPPASRSTYRLHGGQSDSHALAASRRARARSGHGQLLLHGRQEGAGATRDQISDKG